MGLGFRRGRNDAEVTLVINGFESGSVHVPFLMRTFATTPMSFGRDHGSPVRSSRPVSCYSTDWTRTTSPFLDRTGAVSWVFDWWVSTRSDSHGWP